MKNHFSEAWIVMVPLIICYVFKLFLVQKLARQEFAFAIDDDRGFRAMWSLEVPETGIGRHTLML